MNLNYDKSKKVLIIEVAIGEGVMSKTGKSIVVASTNGFITIPGTDMKINLNVIKPVKVV